ncbi:MAG: type II toxin-antitoxin system RelE/ParE family toxin [Gammaproteobacteria bacterium]
MLTRNVTEYIDEYGYSPFGKWFSSINPVAAAKVSTALYRLQQGNTSNTKSVGKGVFEYKIDFGAGYRVYFGQDGAICVILLCGGTKKCQTADIKQACRYWADYKKRKQEY